jgi:hypothetical protein
MTPKNVTKVGSTAAEFSPKNVTKIRSAEMTSKNVT